VLEAQEEIAGLKRMQELRRVSTYRNGSTLKRQHTSITRNEEGIQSRNEDLEEFDEEELGSEGEEEPVNLEINEMGAQGSASKRKNKRSGKKNVIKKQVYKVIPYNLAGMQKFLHKQYGLDRVEREI